MADGSHSGQRQRVRVAYSGEERGFGAGAVDEFLQKAQSVGISDGGTDAVSGARPQELDKNRAMRSYEFGHPTRQPLRTKEQAMMAVKAHTADYAIVPFYHPHYGYDYETLRALASQITLFGVEQITSETEYVLAVYEPQVLDFVQSSHPGSTLSTIMTGAGKHLWSRSGDPGAALTGVHKLPDNSGFMASPAQQAMLRDRVESIFASPVAARACKSKLDGLRQAGVNVEETLETIEPHRDFARRVRDVLDHTRQTATTFDFTSGESRIQSVMPNTQAQARKLYGVVVPREIASGPEYIIIDDKFADADPAKTRFMAVEYSPDLTLFEDAYRTTDAKTRYWETRLKDIVHDGLHSAKKAGAETSIDPVGAMLALAGLLLAAVGVAGLAGWPGVPLFAGAPEMVALADAAALALGAGLTLIGLGRFLKREGGGAHDMNGIRVLLAFQRSGAAAAISDVENFLRNFGVRYQVVRIDEDSERSSPSASVLDIEFMCEDFGWNLSRRLRGPVANGALKKAFARWKSRGVLVLAAMPFAQPQMPPHKRRHWLWDMPGEWAKDFTETMFIRLSRILVYLLPVAAAAYAAWVLMGGGK
ncbi:MAG: hypothetical protein U5J99_14165 [Parvularculaceae bacterium]|nr:hypothetical protein [Parvularculaceae bacterium]